MIARFRFFKIYFGALLGGFLENTGKALEPETKMSQSSILKNETGTKGKLSFYEKSVTTFDLFHYKIVLYMISFLVRIFAKKLVKIMKTKGKINKKLFYFVFFHNRIHFVLFNLYLSGCVFLNARSILHLKYLPDSILLIFEKWLNILCFFFYWCDICELFFTSIDAFTASDNGKGKKSYEEFEGYKYVQEAKTILNEKKNKKNKVADDSTVKALNSSTDNSTLGGMLPTPTSPSDDKVKPYMIGGILPQDLLKKLPDKIPGPWVTEKEAEQMNYSKVDNFEQTMNRIKVNEAMVAFTVHNIGFL